MKDNETFTSPAKSVVNLESPEIADKPKPYSWLKRRYFSKKHSKLLKSHIKSHTKIMNFKLDRESKQFNDLVNSCSDPQFTKLTENVDISGPDCNLMCHTNHAKENGNTTCDGLNRIKIKHDSSESNTAAKKIFECFHCHHRTEALHLLKMHIQIHLADIYDRGSHRNDTLNPNPQAHVKGLHHDNSCAQIQPPKRTNGLLLLPHACPYCDYRCGLLRDLREHVYIHTESKPFYCNICFYRSSTASMLKRHMSTHTGEKPYKCCKCEYKTAYRGSLMKHELRIHRNQDC